MDSRFVERDAEALVARYADSGVNRDLALRVYTTRLLGQDPQLVLHGGGNTSVKTTVPDLLGQETAVLCVKGTGWDMGVMEPPGMPAVRMEPLLRLRARDAVSDEEMVRFQRASLIDPMAPNPSVETLLHAFVPHKFSRTGKKSAPRFLTAAWASCLTSCRASRWRGNPPRCSRRAATRTA
jgi:rhamnose utilization protein RhaD (predicted bifunctional aldolase and dehydrogenase)